MMGASFPWDASPGLPNSGSVSSICPSVSGSIGVCWGIPVAEAIVRDRKAIEMS